MQYKIYDSKTMKYPIYDVDGEVLHVADFRCFSTPTNIRNMAAFNTFNKRKAISWAVKNGKSLRRANLVNFDLSGLDLSGKDFTGANIKYATFYGSDLRGSTFSYDIPVVEKIHQTVLDTAMKTNLLHIKERSLWLGSVITIAGYEGLKLADEIGTATAAALIYIASDPSLERIPLFYGVNKESVAEMNRLAEREKRNND